MSPGRRCGHRVTLCVAAFRTGPLDEAGPFTFVAADALTMKVRGIKVATSETGAAWNAFFADLVARGLHGVRKPSHTTPADLTVQLP